MKKYIILALILTLQFLNAREHLKPTTPYYEKLAKQCQGSSCCLSSLDNLIKGNYTLVPKSKICPRGYRTNMCKCINSYAWCQKDHSPRTKIYHKLINALQIQGDTVKDIGAFKDVLLPIKRIERKAICLKVLKTYEDTNPKVAYSAANCLLYNGYGDLVIPLFTRYIYNGNNEKYFNKRIGYDWLHADNWYQVDPKILTDMLEGLEFYTWTTKQIEDEVLMHQKRYGQKAFANVLKQKMRKILAKKPLSPQEEKSFQNCLNIFVHIDAYTCKINKKSKKLEACQQTFTKHPSTFECRD